MYKTLALLFSLIAVAGTASAWHPLEPLDTSSPRATMATFLDVTDEVASRYLAYVSSPSRETFKAAWSLRPKYTGLFDLSNVPPASRAKVGAETFLLLWDVLARVELPPLEEIPDAAAVATDEAKDGPALRWRIPGTEIAIARIEQGPRAGEFLFSADTVERAKEFHELAQVLDVTAPRRDLLHHVLGDLVRDEPAGVGVAGGSLDQVLELLQVIEASVET